MSEYSTFEVQNIPLLLADSEAGKGENKPSSTVDKSRYDFCMVYRLDDEEIRKDGEGYVGIMQKLGLDVALFTDATKSRAFVLVRASIELLRSFGKTVDLDFLLDEDMLRKYAIDHGIDVAHNPQETYLNPYELIYVNYRPSETIPEESYWRPKGMTHPFRDLIRIQLTKAIIESRPDDGGQNLKIDRYVKNGKILAFYPLQNVGELEYFEKDWLKEYRFPWNEPIDKIKVKFTWSIYSLLLVMLDI